MANPRSWCWPPVPVPACGRTLRRCCTRWQAAACCRTPCTRWPRSRRSTSWWCSATTASEVAPAVAELADELSRPIDIAVQDQQLGTGHAVGCGLAALPADFAGTVVVTSGDVPLLDADTLADLIATHSSEIGRGDGADHDAGRPDRLRPGSAHPGPRGHRHRRRGRRHPVAAGHHARSTPASTRSTSRRCARHWAGCGRTTPSRSST